MQDFFDAFQQAFALIASGDPELIGIVLLSLRVSLTALILACIIGFPIGALLAVSNFPGRRAIILFFNAAMGLPPVVVGLTLYLLFSQAGPLAVLELLYTPTAMIIAQIVLITPIIISLTRGTIAGLLAEHGETLRAMRATRPQMVMTLLREAHPTLLTTAVAGLGRAFAEVGAVMIVGGNINHVTRVMTTSIALETSRGELAMALALGIILLIIALFTNAAVYALAPRSRELAHV